MEQSPYRKLWALDPEAVFLNHGSFGACPAWILVRQQEYRDRLESQPVCFLIRELEGLHDHARGVMAGFVGARQADLVFVTNATTGVNTVFRSLHFEAGDEILITNHIYPACRRLLEYICEMTGARLAEACFPFPVTDPGEILSAILGAVTSRTRIALVDHITASTALILPVEKIVSELDRMGVDTMIDGAHALGQIPLDLDRTGAAYYTANCHKWLCGPKSAAVLHVRKDRQKGIVPVVISHAGHAAEPFAERFYWPATYDPTPALCAADLVESMHHHVSLGWEQIMKKNHELCLDARRLICDALEIPVSCPGEMIGAMASFPLQNPPAPPVFDYRHCDPLQDRLYFRHNIEVPVWQWGQPSKRIIRISAHLYNTPDDYRKFAALLKSGIAG